MATKADIDNAYERGIVEGARRAGESAAQRQEAEAAAMADKDLWRLLLAWDACARRGVREDTARELVLALLGHREPTQP